jgi:hypothetical protein
MSEEEGKDKKSSWALRMKKHLASKGASLDLGKKAVNQFLGEEGVLLLDSLKSAATKDVGEKKAQELYTDIFKMAFKMKFLFDEGLVQNKDVLHFSDPLNHLGVMLVEYLDYSAEDAKEQKKQSGAHNPASRLCAAVSRMRDMTVDLVAEYMQDKNIEKLKGLFNYFGGEHFVALIRTDKLAEERQAMYRSLSIYLKPIVEAWRASEAPPPRACQEPDCKESRIRPAKGFAGSKYCARHHEARFEAVYLDPKLDLFLTAPGSHHTGATLLFSQYILSQPEYAQMGSLWFAIEGIKDFENPKLRKKRARIIFDKYLNKDFPEGMIPGLDQKIIDELERKIDMEHPPKNLFQTVQAQLMTQLKKLFRMFIASSFFYSYAESLITPDSVRSQNGLASRASVLAKLEAVRKSFTEEA